MAFVAFVVFRSYHRIFVLNENLCASEVDLRIKELLVAIGDMRVGCEKHKNSTFDCLVQTEYQFAKVFVALVKILVVEIELKLVALVVTVDNCGENLTLPNEVLANQLHPKVRVKVILKNFHRRESSASQYHRTWFLIYQKLFENVSWIETVYAEMCNVLLTQVTSLLIIVVFISANEHLEIVHLFRRIQTFHQLLYLPNLGKHIDNLA
jgi:hypothetical protein